MKPTFLYRYRYVYIYICINRSINTNTYAYVYIYICVSTRTHVDTPHSRLGTAATQEPNTSEHTTCNDPPEKTDIPLTVPKVLRRHALSSYSWRGQQSHPATGCLESTSQNWWRMVLKAAGLCCKGLAQFEDDFRSCGPPQGSLKLCKWHGVAQTL